MIVDIEKLDNFGRGITYINDKICFVEDAYPKEKVKIKIIKETSKYIEAKQINVIKENPYRIKSKCPYYKECGGCSLITYDYKEENKYKENKVKEKVNKLLKLNENIVKDIVFSNEFNYRNKVLLHGNKEYIGLYKNNTHEIVKIDKCLLLSTKINNIINKLNDYQNIEEVLIRTSNNDEESIIDIKGNINNIEMDSNVLIINNDYKTNNKCIKTNIGEKKYYLSSNSFFQINNILTKALYDEIKENIDKIKPNKVLDLYTGTGSIAIYIAESCGEVIGIDYNKSNIEDANLNKELNNQKNIRFICNKVENEIDNFKDIDLIIVDPPRGGLDNKTKNYLKTISPDTIIYVSCDLNTLIRDLKDLSDTYEIDYIKPFNMFPRTYHVETVTVLTRKN